MLVDCSKQFRYYCLILHYILCIYFSWYNKIVAELDHRKSVLDKQREARKAHDLATEKRAREQKNEEERQAGQKRDDEDEHVQNEDEIGGGVDADDISIGNEYSDGDEDSVAQILTFDLDGDAGVVEDEQEVAGGVKEVSSDAQIQHKKKKITPTPARVPITDDMEAEL